MEPIQFSLSLSSFEDEGKTPKQRFICTGSLCDFQAVDDALHIRTRLIKAELKVQALRDENKVLLEYVKAYDWSHNEKAAYIQHIFKGVSKVDERCKAAAENVIKEFRAESIRSTVEFLERLSHEFAKEREAFKDVLRHTCVV